MQRGTGILRMGTASSKVKSTPGAWEEKHTKEQGEGGDTRSELIMLQKWGRDGTRQKNCRKEKK